MFDAGMNQAAPNAKGNAFDYGLQAFAKGGAFTNSIVNSPTLFKFAKGTGMMGEAGPEAIMPLKRDSNGNLGVRAQGGNSNVEVVVNNYSTAQAETRETVDSRGNRRIEVIVGDMVAQEVSKTGSATQNAFSSTYGTRPALARR
jgi:lambda family phage tail tape measure protein